jgi:hypothetical protein
MGDANDSIPFVEKREVKTVALDRDKAGSVAQPP